MRLDPLSLPVRFDAHDTRADGGVRQIELHRERVVLRRAIQGMRMSVNISVSDFRGIALREIGETQLLVLIHRDPSLNIPLYARARTATRSQPPGEAGAISSPCRNFRTAKPPSPRPVGAGATRSAGAGRDSCCAVASAIPWGQTSIATSARSSRRTRFQI